MATQQELDDLRLDLGDTNNAFSDDELERLLERSSTPDGDPQHYVALYIGLMQLLNQASRFATYTVNEAQERRSEIAKNLRESLKLLEGRADVQEMIQQGAGGGMQTRALAYTRTRGRYEEYSRPDLPDFWGHPW